MPLRSLSALQAAPLIKSIPKEAYGALPFALAPLLSNPIAMAANKALGAKSPFEAVQKIGQGMLDMLPGLGKLAEILPQDTLLWKLRLLDEGCRYMDTRYHMVCPVHFQHLYATRPRLRCMPVTFASSHACKLCAGGVSTLLDTAVELCVLCDPPPNDAAFSRFLASLLWPPVVLFSATQRRCRCLPEPLHVMRSLALPDRGPPRCSTGSGRLCRFRSACLWLRGQGTGSSQARTRRSRCRSSCPTAAPACCRGAAMPCFRTLTSTSLRSSGRRASSCPFESSPGGARPAPSAHRDSECLAGVDRHEWPQSVLCCCLCAEGCELHTSLACQSSRCVGCPSE